MAVLSHLVSVLDGFLPFPFVDSMIMFYIYGFIGWIVEVIYYGVTEEKFINRGFLNGPHCPVYGIGFYGVIWFFRRFIHNFPLLFFGSAFIATTVELIAGVVLYAIFHMRWWDYSEYKFNFHGFICLRFFIYWGLACSLGMYMLHPSVMYVIDHTMPPIRIVVVVIFSMIMAIDIIVTVTSIFRLSDKVKFIGNISGGIRLVSDKLGSQIYGTVDNIVTTTTPVVETTNKSYAEFREMYSRHREEEKELSKKHRAEERELLGTYVDIGKQGLVKTKDAAGAKFGNLLGTLKSSEIRILSSLRPGRGDDNDETIRYLQDQLEDMRPTEGKK